VETNSKREGERKREKKGEREREREVQFSTFGAKNV
jgi:hypothetical protein